MRANPDKGRVASNIVQGIGFLGAGLILHTRDRVLGLTSAATVFVVASIGMACGAGLYIEAALATAIVLICADCLSGVLRGSVGWQRLSVDRMRCAERSEQDVCGDPERVGSCGRAVERRRTGYRGGDGAGDLCCEGECKDACTTACRAEGQR